jgi:hypothetical protein
MIAAGAGIRKAYDRAVRATIALSGASGARPVTSCWYTRSAAAAAFCFFCDVTSGYNQGTERGPLEVWAP